MPKSSIPELRSVPPGVGVEKDYSDGSSLVLCHHDDSLRREINERITMCTFCRGDEFTTDQFRKPVKLLFRLIEDARQTQTTLL